MCYDFYCIGTEQRQVQSTPGSPLDNRFQFPPPNNLNLSNVQSASSSPPPNFDVVGSAESLVGRVS